MDEDERIRLALRCGANIGAAGVMARRVEARVAHAMLADLHGQGLIVVKKDDWHAADNLVQAVRKIAAPRDDY